MGAHEDKLYNMLKEAEETGTNESDSVSGSYDVYKDPGEVIEDEVDQDDGGNHNTVVFSDAVRDTNQDVRQGVLDRTLAQKQKASTEARKAMGALLTSVGAGLTESSSPLLGDIKVAYPRSKSLSEMVKSKLGNN